MMRENFPNNQQIQISSLKVSLKKKMSKELQIIWKLPVETSAKVAVSVPAIIPV